MGRLCGGGRNIRIPTGHESSPRLTDERSWNLTLMEQAMRTPHVDDVVRLNQDIPELELHRGQTGVVRSTWFAPTVAYEVEFDFSSDHHAKRALLLERQVTVEKALFDFDTNVDRQD